MHTQLILDPNYIKMMTTLLALLITEEVVFGAGWPS